MKDYEEMADSVLRRIEDYEARKQQRQKAVRRTVIPLMCVCLALLIGVGVWQGLFDYSCTQQRLTAVTVPAIRLPDSGTTADMIGLVVYKGGIYTQAEEYFGEDAERIAGLVGYYLGHGTGSIDEWSDQEDFAEEFASTFPCGVYTVKGYSTDFRLCTVGDFETENGVTEKYILFLERLNGIELRTGVDLFSQRLGLWGRVASVQYQTHADWNQARGSYQDATLTAEERDAFLSALYEGTFEYTYPTNPDIYDSKTQAHVYLHLTDGTTVELRLIEGGYVGYQALGWYFVKMPTDAFDAVMNACK